MEYFGTMMTIHLLKQQQQPHKISYIFVRLVQIQRDKILRLSFRMKFIYNHWQHPSSSLLCCHFVYNIFWCDSEAIAKPEDNERSERATERKWEEGIK